jgi:hypothetical protein
MCPGNIIVQETRIHGWKGAGVNAKPKLSKICPLLGERKQVREDNN